MVNQCTLTILCALSMTVVHRHRQLQDLLNHRLLVHGMRCRLRGVQPQCVRGPEHRRKQLVSCWECNKNAKRWCVCNCMELSQAMKSWQASSHLCKGCWLYLHT